jgi:Pyridine nucleotide-disulphide oxidoreductase, dimerisation domain
MCYQQLLIEEGSDRILGAHLLGPHADEIVNLFAIAIAAEMPAASLKESLFAYPTVSSDIRSCCDLVSGRRRSDAFTSASLFRSFGDIPAAAVLLEWKQHSLAAQSR